MLVGNSREYVREEGGAVLMPCPSQEFEKQSGENLAECALYLCLCHCSKGKTKREGENKSESEMKFRCMDLGAHR